MLPANLERTDGTWRSGQGVAVNGDKPSSGSGRPGPGDASRNLVSDDDLARRRERLGASLTAKGVGQKPEQERGAGSAAGYGQALRLSSEFIAAVAVGGGLGWFIDRFAGTSPWGMIVFLLLGFAAGVLNVMRSAGLVAEAGIRSEKRSDRRDG